MPPAPKLPQNLTEAEKSVWLRTPHALLRTSDLDLFAGYCRHVAAGEILSQRISEWSDMDPLSELKELYAMRQKEVAAAAAIHAKLSSRLTEPLI